MLTVAITTGWMSNESPRNSSTLHPELDPVLISFPDLKALVLTLSGFREQDGHPCNERILEAIQQSWIDERDE